MSSNSTRYNREYARRRKRVAARLGQCWKCCAPLDPDSTRECTEHLSSARAARKLRRWRAEDRPQPRQEATA